MRTTDLDIQRNDEAGRYEATVEGHLCVLDFSLDGSLIRMNHVGVPDAVGGRGIAGQLTRHALDEARERGLGVVPNCPYVAAWIEKHPEYGDLIA